MSTSRPPSRARLAHEHGFTMIVAIGVLFVTSLLLVAAFTVANGDVHQSRQDTTQKQAYYGALAGVQAFEARLQANPDYWQACETLAGSVSEQSAESYEVKLLPAESAPEGTKECNPASPRASVIESKGQLVNTFRIKSTGTAKTSASEKYKASAKREAIATFHVTGFLNFAYYTNFEQGDPALFREPRSEPACAGKHYSEWSGGERPLKCQQIVFGSNDSVYGPMHTNDAADIASEVTFGRKEHNPPDVVEINGGTHPVEGCGEGSPATYYTATNCFTKGPSLEPPENDTTLSAYVENANHFEGVTRLELKGSAKPPTIAVTRFRKEAGGEFKEITETIPWPSNGLIYVQKQSSRPCTFALHEENADTAQEAEEELGCGTAYVKGSYSKSLTVAGENEVIINGNLYPTSVEGSLGSEPTSTPTLGLIASQNVRVYHPCSREKNGAGSLNEPYIYAAILSTSHSFLVDNWGCGEGLGKLHIWGAIAQDYRGPVGTTGGTGYIKDYKYDERLATSEPPFFLAPLKAGWSIIRETAPNPG